MYGQELYSQTGYGATSQNTVDPEDYFINLMIYLPKFYQSNRAMNELQKSLGYEVGEINYDTQDIINQCFISTATWGLNLWEQLFNLPTNESLSYERRREILMAKRRGTGTVTKEMIKNVCEAFSGGEVSVIEYPKEYRFVIQFIGVMGIPPNMAGLINAINEIKPAHLDYSFKYTYTTWGMVSNLTWGDVQNKTWGEIKTYGGE